MTIRFLAILVLAPVASACHADATFNTNFASGFAPGGHTVSVFGVYKDGQMSSSSWGSIGPKVAAALGASRCDPAFDATLATTNADLASAVEDYTRADGPTDDLLVQLAPAAKGDLILVVTFAGKLPPPDKGPNITKEPSTMGGNGQGSMQNWKSRAAAPSTDELDLSASLFSVAHSQSVAVVAMQYTGGSIDDAIAKFATKLGHALPQATCAGWNWDAKLDPERIRKSIEP